MYTWGDKVRPEKERDLRDRSKIRNGKMTLQLHRFAQGYVYRKIPSKADCISQDSTSQSLIPRVLLTVCH